MTDNLFSASTRALITAMGIATAVAAFQPGNGNAPLRQHGAGPAMRVVQIQPVTVVAQRPRPREPVDGDLSH